MERLEDVLAPAHLALANLTWGNITGDGNAMNFNDYYVTGTQIVATAPLQQGDNLTFDGFVSSANAAGLTGFGLPVAPAGTPSSQLAADADYGSINLINGYNGTVALAPDAAGVLTVAALTQTSGTLAQQAVNPQTRAGTSTDLTVYGALSWAGGVLGGPALPAVPPLPPANVFLEGGGQIQPTNAGTVTLASTLIFDALYGATTVTQNRGTVMVNAYSGGEDIKPNATLTAVTTTSGDIIGITQKQAGASTVQIEANGTLNLIGPGAYSNNLPFSNSGSLNLSGSVKATLSGTGTSGGQFDYTQYGTGNLRMDNGSVLTVAKAVDILGGVVALSMNKSLPAAQQTATINGQFQFDGGLIIFGVPITIHSKLVYGTFTVNGAVTWNAGTYEPSVDYTNVGLANRWIINTPDGTVGMTVNFPGKCIVLPNALAGKPPKSSAWLVLDASSTNEALPKVNPDPQGNQLTIGNFQNAGRTQWQLASPAS